MKWKKDNYEISDNEIRVLGDSPQKKGTPKGLKWFVLLLLASAVLALLKGISKGFDETPSEEVEGLYEQDAEALTDSASMAYVEIQDLSVSGIPMRMSTPKGAKAELAVGRQDLSDSTIVYFCQAADVRADDRTILGDFVLNGKQLAVGHSKWGWCSIENGQVRLGYDKMPDALQQSIDHKASFFRQYGLIADGKYVKDTSSKRYEAIRRALCTKDGEAFIMESLEPVNFVRFAHALEDFHVDYAISLLGATTYGFAKTKNGDRIEFGEYNSNLVLETTSYIIWR